MADTPGSPRNRAAGGGKGARSWWLAIATCAVISAALLVVTFLQAPA